MNDDSDSEYCPTVGNEGLVVDCLHCPDRFTCKESTVEKEDE